MEQEFPSALAVVQAKAGDPVALERISNVATRQTLQSLISTIHTNYIAIRNDLDELKKARASECVSHWPATQLPVLYGPSPPPPTSPTSSRTTRAAQQVLPSQNHGGGTITMSVGGHIRYRSAIGLLYALPIMDAFMPPGVYLTLIHAILSDCLSRSISFGVPACTHSACASMGGDLFSCPPSEGSTFVVCVETRKNAQSV